MGFASVSTYDEIRDDVMETIRGKNEGETVSIRIIMPAWATKRHMLEMDLFASFQTAVNNGVTITVYKDTFLDTMKRIVFGK